MNLVLLFSFRGDLCHSTIKAWGGIWVLYHMLGLYICFLFVERFLVRQDASEDCSIVSPRILQWCRYYCCYKNEKKKLHAIRLVTTCSSRQFIHDQVLFPHLQIHNVARNPYWETVIHLSVLNTMLHKQIIKIVFQTFFVYKWLMLS